MQPVIVRRWIRSKKFSSHVQGCSASSISNLTFGGTLVSSATVRLDVNESTYHVGCIGLRSVAVTSPALESGIFHNVAWIQALPVAPGNSSAASIAQIPVP